MPPRQRHAMLLPMAMPLMLPFLILSIFAFRWLRAAPLRYASAMFAPPPTLPPRFAVATPPPFLCHAASLLPILCCFVLRCFARRPLPRAARPPFTLRRRQRHAAARHAIAARLPPPAIRQLFAATLRRATPFRHCHSAMIFDTPPHAATPAFACRRRRAYATSRRCRPPAFSPQLLPPPAFAASRCQR